MSENTQHSGFGYARIRTPETFNGDRTQLRNFLSSCDIYIMLHEKQFQEQSARVLFASSFLSGAAFNWFQPYLAKKLKSVTLTPAAPLAASRGFYAASEELPEAPPPEVLPREVTDYEAFKQGLTNTFGDLDAIATAERKL